MWRLTSTSLPTEATKRRGAPIATVWAKNSRVMAPVCRLSSNGEAFDLPEPQFLGYFHLLETPWLKGKMLGIEGFTLGKTNRAEASTYWYRGRRVGVVAPDTNPIAVKARVILPVPIPDDNYLYRINFSDWGNVEVVKVTSEGMVFSPAADPENLVHPEWKFEDSLLTFAGEYYCAPRLNGQMEIEIELTSTIISAKVFKFKFPSNITQCDLIEYLGHSYKITANLFPSLYQFIWNASQQTAYAFGEVG